MSFVVCDACHKQYAASLKQCPFCASGMIARSEIGRVSIVDVDMPFWSMVSFMVKWAIAAIPAMVVLLIAGWFVLSILSAIIIIGQRA